MIASLHFSQPAWLLLIPILGVAGWLWRQPGLHHPLRAMSALIFVLLLADPVWRRLTAGVDLWVLADRSASAATALEPNLGEWEKLIADGQGPEDRLWVVDFADSPRVRDDAKSRYFELSRDRTRTALALEHTLGKMDSRRASRLLLLTDGQSTEPLAGLRTRLLEQRVALDYRVALPEVGDDVQVQTFSVPRRVQPGEAFLVEFQVTGRPDGEVPWVMYKNGEKAGEGSVIVRGGKGSARLTDRLKRSGATRYEVRIAPAKDSIPGNNSASAWVEVTGGAGVLLVSLYPDDPVATVLRQQGFTVDLRTDPENLAGTDLTGRSAVLLNNVPAHRLKPDFLESAQFAVTHQGMGFLMAGGRFSFGSGGYFGSPVADILPVSMELREEQRKLAVAMAIVLDRSGSMAAGVAGGRTKMDLANEGTARAIELLGAQDAVSVFAVDSSPHEIVPLTTLGANREKLIESVRRIRSMGGGIFVHTGLKAGWAELQKAKTGAKHLILFADAADAEEPGAYVSLLKEITAAGATVSVIGLGADTDSDANFLKDIAARGNGRIFFNADAAGLPALFEQETVAIARSAFLKEPTALNGMPGWLEIASRPIPWLPSVDGYNLSYLKPGATAGAVTADGESAPLVAYWQRGAGRVAAVSFPLAGEASDAVRAWPGYGDLVQTLVRWAVAGDAPPGTALRTSMDGDELTLDLLYDASWVPRIAESAPKVFLHESSAGVSEKNWERMGPGHFTLRTNLAPGKPISGVVQVGGYVLPFGPVSAALEAEWRTDPARVGELRSLSRATGGVERRDLSSAWETPPGREGRSLRFWLLVLLLIIVPVEIYLWRTQQRFFGIRQNRDEI